MRTRECLHAQQHRKDKAQDRPRSSSNQPVNNFYFSKLLNNAVSEQLPDKKGNTPLTDELPSSQTTTTPSVTAFEAFFE